MPPEGQGSPDAKGDTASFAPVDLTDGRKPWEWRSRWSPEARRMMALEASYLTLLLFLGPVLLLLLATGRFGDWDSGNMALASRPAAAWLGGLLGGTIFGIKWLYHTAAKGSWHEDRRLWRLLTPHVSGGLACSFAILAGSGLIAIFDRQSFTSVGVNFGFGFVVGYFSDAAIAKLAELAEVLFGPTKAGKRGGDKDGGDQGSGSPRQ